MKTDPIKLTVASDDEIIIPALMGAGPLSLEELGGLVIFMGMVHALKLPLDDPERQAFDARFNDPAIERMVKDFRDREIVSATIEDGTLRLIVDLDKALFAKPTP